MGDHYTSWDFKIEKVAVQYYNTVIDIKTYLEVRLKKYDNSPTCR